MSGIFEKHYDYLLNYLEGAIQKDHLSPSIILEGSDVLTQYALALEIARRLNCIEDGNKDCRCRNCNWIRENKHPAVNTVSKIDNKTDDKMTVISEEQVKNILDTLINPSDFHRVFIFCDAQIKPPTAIEEKRLNHFRVLGFNTPQEDTEKGTWYPSGLNFGCFGDTAANSMLKSIEEPPERVTFIFLTENRNDLISTVISRSQTFIVPAFEREEYDLSFFSQVLNNYPSFSYSEAIPFSQALLKYQKDSGYTIFYILDCMQQYIKELIKSNLNNEPFVKKGYRDIEKLEEFKKMSDAFIKDNVIYENLSLYLAGK
ncbi:hypothetical protein IKQ26_00385 [bacterium]|nr:hypothetical protein [bacterium]